MNKNIIFCFNQVKKIIILYLTKNNKKDFNEINNNMTNNTTITTTLPITSRIKKPKNNNKNYNENDNNIKMFKNILFPKFRF